VALIEKMKVRNKECKHDWERVGLWDGRDQETKERIGGPLFKCKKCENKKMVRWGEDLEEFLNEQNNG